ncbi:SDR family oxidoreductase [Paenibacillus sp. LHD-117]|uniref:dTDP-4-dehydrorhamnose reductase family protein n=1 Tax=Paenibacillus sp. LHD-117 TaxID=3071412 RepID=UPI0027E1CC48|nr:SDR family oxidoreductase [Paenibacillus sp. LHD-117]MDQ6423509.1 SDR family oxidoreductase [Paenibacillus sp. LHD-117]
MLVFGGNGMAGHMIVDYLESRGYDIWFTVRSDKGYSPSSKLVTLDVRDQSAVHRCLLDVKPDVVVNATGLLNDDAAYRKREAIYVNSLFPHLLSGLGSKLGFRLIHISTDCVFSGAEGGYDETSPADGLTYYAKSKSLGEVTDPPDVTIRTSIIGPELKPNGIGLFHWLMGQQGVIKGYSNVFWNGVTTLELAKAIEDVMLASVSGIVHLAVPDKISKYELLLLIKDTFDRDSVIIVPNGEIFSDKSLASTRSDFRIQPAPYPVMIRELKTWMDHSERNYPYLL